MQMFSNFVCRELMWIRSCVVSVHHGVMGCVKVAQLVLLAALLSLWVGEFPSFGPSVYGESISVLLLCF